MSIPIHRFKVGRFECIAVLDHQKMSELDGIFLNVDRRVLEEAARALNNQLEATPFAYAPLVIRTGEQQVLIDTGHPQEYAGQPIVGQFLQNLRAAGIAPEDITIIMITHCHGDHIGGLTDANSALLYPNARYFMHRDEWEYWMDETFLAGVETDFATFLRSKLLPIKDKLTLVDAETEILPGITIVPLPGHTIGHAGVRLESLGESLLHIADTAHVLAQLGHPEWSPRFDRLPDIAVRTRRAVFEQAAQTKQPLIAYHFPFPGLGQVVPTGAAFAWQPIPPA